MSSNPHGPSIAKRRSPRRTLLVVATGALLSLGCGDAPPKPDKPIPPPLDISELRGDTAPAPPEEDSR